MARVKTFTNGGSLLPGDLNSIEDDYEYSFSTYKTLVERGTTQGSGSVAGTYVLWRGNVTGSTTFPTSGQQDGIVFYLDPADYTANTRTTKYRVRADVAVNSVAPAINFTFGLYPVTFGGSAGAITVTLGTVVTGSTVAINTPGASAGSQGNSGDFTAPAAGWYALGVVLSGTTPANTLLHHRALLQFRQV